jgi:hypothetical protein
MRKSTHLDDREDVDVFVSAASEAWYSGVDLALFCLADMEGGFHAVAPTIFISD